MTETKTKVASSEETAVDDVRKVREQIERESGGDLRKHVEQTNQLVEELREKLGLRIVDSPPREKRPDGKRT